MANKSRTEGGSMAQPLTDAKSAHASIAAESQREDGGVPLLAEIDCQQPIPQEPLTTKLPHECSIKSEDSNPYLAGELVEGQDHSTKKVPIEDWAAVLIQGQKGFKLEASFDHVPTGYYNIVWTIRRQDLFRIKGAFQIRVIVEYEKEPWHKARYEFKHKKRSIKKALKETGWQPLTSTERIQVHPHIGGANITVVLNRSSKVEGFGIQFEKVELKKAAMTTPGRFNKEIVANPDFRVHASDDPSFEVISRLEYSREGHYLAALIILKHAVKVQVWDIRDVQNSHNENIAYRGAVVSIPHKHARHLAIGMAISPSGDQIAVFQEPRIGRWEANSTIDSAEFRLRVFRNPLVKQDCVVVDMKEGSSAGLNAKNTTQKLQEIDLEFKFLHNMIGYGQFVSFAEHDDEDDDSLPTPRRRQPARIHAHVTKFLRQRKKSREMKPSLFVSCNGYYLDVFDSSSPKWAHLQTIELNNLSPLYSRRFTCESMMELIAGDRLLWFENGNRCCSVWDIMTGTNVSHIETTPVKLNDVRGNNTLSVSPNYEYLAIAGADGSISTYMIDSGVRLDKRKFPGATIEYIGFHGNQSDELFVFVRDTLTRELKWFILDPFKLRSERPTRAIPVPTKDGAIMAPFKDAGSDDRNLVCVPNGPDIEFFWTSSKPKASAQTHEGDQSASTLVPEITTVSIEADKNDVISYEIKTVVFTIKNATGTNEPRPAQGIEIYMSKDGSDGQSLERIFAMVPEPWVWLDLEEDAVKQPRPLSAFFLPCKKRFAIIGSYTVQIWNLPLKTESKCTLYCYWSQPLAQPQGDLKRLPNFYRSIRSGQFHQDSSGRQWISVNLGSKKYQQIEKFEVCSHGMEKSLVLQYCIQSIYFLAATHLFASTGGNLDDIKVTSRSGIIDFNEQARSIKRFVQDRINKTIPVKGLDVYHLERPTLLSAPTSENIEQQPTESSLNLERAKKDTSDNTKRTSILLRLVDPDYFLVSNASFIVAILGSGDCNWIPPQDIKLNPVLKAAKSGNTNLTQSLIDYCVLMTRKHHPYYMLPVVQSIEVLAEHFPDMLKDTLLKVSYVPALPYALSTSRIYMFRRRWNIHLGPIETALEFLKILQPRGDDDVASRPVYQMQPYLNARRIPDGANRIKIFPKDTTGSHSSSGNSSNGTGNHIHDLERITGRRPAADESSRSKRAMIATMYDRQVFVAPFPCFSTYADPNSTDNRATYFSRLAGRNFFESPAMKATLVFRWYRYGFVFWLMRFLYLFAFYLIFTVITAHVIAISSNPTTADDINKRYLSVPWKGLILANAIMGAPLLLLEVWQMVREGWLTYTSSLFNFVDCLSVSLVIVSNSLLLVNSNRNPADDGGRGPHQVWVVGFSILIMYLHLMFELRVIRSLGIFVNIIISITKKIFIFFILFTVLIVGFSHTLMYSTHTHQVPCVPGSEGCDLTEGATKYPDGFFKAVAATYFFIGGRWDPLDDELDKPNDVAFHIIMIVFLFFLVILLMNTLIAIMNMAYEECREEGEMAWLKQWSQVLDEIAHTFLTPWQKQTYLPDYVYYEATMREVMSFNEENGLTNLENSGVGGGAAAAKMEGGKYTFVAIDREELSSTMQGTWSLPGTLKKAPSPQIPQPEQLPESSSTLVQPSFSIPNSSPSGATDEVATSSEQVTAREAVPATVTKPAESFSAMYEDYYERYENLQSRFDHILEEEFETLEATEDCTSHEHNQQEHAEAKDRLEDELKVMLTTARELSEEMKRTLVDNQVPLEENESRREATSSPQPAASTDPTDAEIEISSPLPPASPLSDTTAPLPLPTGSDESSQNHLTLDMVRLRELYFSVLELERNIDQEYNPM
ncbi:hypothetical protein BGW41_001862 [Actinomortierella wolfii]|nr:hypothetical protein BGW41_001862 [Actinomortierella wolfii]